MTRHYLNATLQCCNGNCSRSARDYEREKKIDEIASADELKLERIEKIKKSLRSMSAEELDDELLKLREELDNMKNDKQDSKSGLTLEKIGYNNYESKGNYAVLTYNEPTASSRVGEKLLISLGSSD